MNHSSCIVPDVDPRAQMAQRERAEYREKHRAAFPLLRVKIADKSMMPEFRRGAIIEFRRVDLSSELQPGRAYYIKLRGGAGMVRVLLDRSELGLVLIAPNARHSKTIYTPFAIIEEIGIAVAVVAPIKSTWLSRRWWRLKSFVMDAIAALRPPQKEDGSPINLLRSEPASNGTTKAIEQAA